MSRKQAIFLMVLSAIFIILCILGLYFTYKKDKQMREDAKNQPSTVETLESVVVDEKIKAGDENIDNNIVDGEEDEQYIINDIGYDAYMQLTGEDYPDGYCDTSVADKTIERYYRRKNVTPQPIPKATTEAKSEESETDMEKLEVATDEDE